MDSKKIKEFQNQVMDWWCINARDLPWRRNPTPYHVLVSEMMLQQTQVTRVIPKYHEFLEHFPDIKELAKADAKKLLQVWSGLGYNRRALWLKEAAKHIAEMREFPSEMEELRKLKGIGPYTSRSILIFAFNRDLAAVDTNIRRVFIAAGFATEEMSKRAIQEVADHLLLKGRSSDWHNALMDYGSQVLTSSSTGIAPRTTQSIFVGSTRQLRGKIVRVLTQSQTISEKELLRRLELDVSQQNQFSCVLDQLIKEKMVEKINDDSYRIPSGY
ncbi:MAG: Fe-S cluster assembly protein HesB [Candidatus Lokiarchaeota archaeon]|nr:Fe-S cluster assembly protein HesB [Candidatus Lokiarchaeota archaeon]